MRKKRKDVVEIVDPQEIKQSDEVSGEQNASEMVQLLLSDYELLLEKAKATVEAEQQVLRWQADFENYRRRMARDREELYAYASQELIQKMLPVLDNFDRAVAVSYLDLTTLRSGVEMIQKQQMELLAKEGLTPISPLGEHFDPNYHEAVMRCDADEQTEDNTVVEVLQKGYLLKDRLLRPALVKVASK